MKYYIIFLLYLLHGITQIILDWDVLSGRHPEVIFEKILMILIVGLLFYKARQVDLLKERINKDKTNANSN